MIGLWHYIQHLLYANFCMEFQLPDVFGIDLATFMQIQYFYSQIALQTYIIELCRLWSQGVSLGYKVHTNNQRLYFSFCRYNLDDCHSAATCQDTHGSFDCVCNSGYVGTGKDCDDVDECEEDPDACSTFAVCANTAGAYTCTCNDGYTGDGFNCTGEFGHKIFCYRKQNDNLRDC